MEKKGTMTITDITMINDLDDLKTDFIIKVKIIKRVDKRIKADPKNIVCVEFVLMDEQGSKIEAILHKRVFRDFFNRLREDQCYLIVNPTLAESNEKYRQLDRKQKVSFTSTTTIKECTNFAGTKYGLQFVSFRTILDGKISEKDRIDVIGIVTKCYNIEKKMRKNGIESEFLNLTLKDLEECKLEVALWGDYAIQMSNYILKNPNETDVVLILQLGVVMDFKGTISLSNSFSISRMFINTDMDEVNNFKKSFFEGSHTIKLLYP